MDAETVTLSISGKTVGGPAAADPAACSGWVIRVLGEAAGPGMRLSSLSLDVTSHALGDDDVDLAVRIDKRARTIVFASCEARAGGRLVFLAQALFSRQG